MNFMFPDLGALCIAENCTHTMHNTLPFRGALARDTLAWSKYIHEAMLTFEGRIDLLFATHNWPVWGADAIGEVNDRSRRFRVYQHRGVRVVLDQVTDTVGLELFVHDAGAIPDQNIRTGLILDVITQVPVRCKQDFLALIVQMGDHVFCYAGSVKKRANKKASCCSLQI